MAAIYLYLNAALYALFALWCTASAERTAHGIGYSALTPGGRSEYLVVYGGLQAGLAIVFFVLARDPARQRLGMWIALALYGPIVAYRLITLVRFWPVGATTVGTAVLEFALLAAAIAITFLSTAAFPPRF